MADDDPTNQPGENSSERRSDASPVGTPHLWVYGDEGHDSWTHADTGLTVRITKQYGKSGRHDDFRWHGRIRGDAVAEPLTWGGRNSLDSIRAVAAKFMNADPDGEYEPDMDAGTWERERARWPEHFEGIEDEFADPDVWLR